MNKITFAFIAAALAGCGQQVAHQETQAQNNQVSVPAEASPELVKVISKEEREKIIAEATSGFRLQRDKMEKISFYLPKTRKTPDDRLSLYISIPDDKKAILRVYPFYYGDEWVFFDAIKVMADDEVVYEKHLDRYRDIATDNSGGNVWEIADYVAEDSDIAAFRKIASASKVTIRFSGREKREDFDLSKREIENIGNALTAFNKLSAL